MSDSDIKKILVVDDNEILVRSIARHLRREGFDVVVAYDGVMAKDLVLAAELGGAPFDLAITDILMPNMDGFTFVSWLNLEFPQMPVVVVTGFGNVDMINKLLRPNLDLVHRKPVLPREIMASIQKINLRRQGGGNLVASA
ncbi:MAG: response regulator [Proteobacteria bacterium]|nr:response regulator [Pseudomonadota bacterium]MBU1641473.1 response regulator [Pseudomonadota bacterium]